MNMKNEILIEGYVEYISANKNLSKNTIKSIKMILKNLKFIKNIELTNIGHEKGEFINYSTNNL